MKIGVLGLGLIGGSIYKKLSELNYDLVGVSRTVNEEGVYRDLSALIDCSIVFVCTPMNKTLDMLDKLNDILNKNTIVTDVCSLKEFVAHKNYKFKFIPSHPMAGTEKSGWDNSFSTLFEGANWAVTLKEDTKLEDFEKLKSVINSLGAKTVLTTPKEHDRAVALISHAPMLVAQALCKNIERNKLAQELASSGFRDTTRLALSNVEMANDMVNMNSENIKSVIKLLNENLDELLDCDYENKAQEIKEFRELLYS